MSFQTTKLPWLDRMVGRGNPQEEAPQVKPIKEPEQQTLWGPYHSSDSEDEPGPVATTTPRKSTHDSSPSASRGGSGNTNPNQGSDSASASHVPAAANNKYTSSSSNISASPASIWEQAESFLSIPVHTNLCRWTEVVSDACSTSPCQPRDLFNDFARDDDQPILGIVPLQGPSNNNSTTPDGMQPLQGSVPEHASSSLVVNLPTAETATTSVDHAKAALDHSFSQSSSPAERRRQRYERRLQKQPAPHRTHEEIEVSPNHHIQVRLPPQDMVKPNNNNNNNKSKTAATKSHNNTRILDRTPHKKFKLPLETLEVKTDEAAALERSISELTMRSSYAAAHAAGRIDNAVFKAVPENKSRRMAYYAVGKHHRQAGRGGNRRCYFTGKLILGGAPFYAGSVQQGMRTLVVFCLPSALGLPDKDALLRYSHKQMMMNQSSPARKRMGSHPSRHAVAANGTILSVQPAFRESRTGHSSSGARSAPPSAPHLQMDTARGLLLRAAAVGGGASSSKRSAQASIASKSYASKASQSRLSSLDDLSLSIDGDLDPNWGLDRDVLLAVLPPASPDILKQMADVYPEQFETLPVQVRQPAVWKLYVKFCFFSGLPIAEGELHYKVRDDIAEQVYGEEIALSHEVMEASTSRSSAEILTLPNRAVLRYLSKHYSQQCSKLDERVFNRANWERVSPEF